MIDLIAALPARILAAINAASAHPITWVGLGLVVFAAVVLGGMHLHLRRTERAARKSNARRYDI